MVSDTRIKEIAENCHDDLNRCYELNTVGTVEDAIKQALAEEREANTLLDECKRLFIGINDTCIDIVHGSASGIDAEKLSPRLKQMITKIKNRNKP